MLGTTGFAGAAVPAGPARRDAVAGAAQAMGQPQHHDPVAVAVLQLPRQARRRRGAYA